MYSILKLTTVANKKSVVYFEILFKNTLVLRFYLFAVLTATLHSSILLHCFHRKTVQRLITDNPIPSLV